MRSILSLPPVLQNVWSRVYAAEVVQGRNRTIEQASESAENTAWEAVRRANGGEMPEEASTSSDPTDEEMVEALAPIVAELSHGSVSWVQNEPFHDVWIGQARLCMLGQPSTWTYEFRAHCAIALASWKAARAWGRK